MTVTQGSQQLVLSQPYAGARVGKSALEAYPSSAADVQARYGAALAAQPLPPAQFTLYFVEGKDEFTDESKKIVDSVFAEIAKRPIPDVIVIGHTDTVGNDAAERRLVAPARRGRSQRLRRPRPGSGQGGRRRPRQARAGRGDRRRCLRGAQSARRDPGALTLRPSPATRVRTSPDAAVDRTAPANGQDGQVIVWLGAVGEGQHIGLQRGHQVARTGVASGRGRRSVRSALAWPYSAPVASWASVTPSVIRQSISPGTSWQRALR